MSFDIIIIKLNVILYNIYTLSPAPPISVLISDSDSNPTIGKSYSLTCSVAGAENLNSTVFYQWTKNIDTTSQTQVGINSNILSFSPLRLSDAANYTCRVVIDSSFLSSSISSMTTYDVEIESELIMTADVLVTYLHCFVSMQSQVNFQ